MAKFPYSRPTVSKNHYKTSRPDALFKCIRQLWNKPKSLNHNITLTTKCYSSLAAKLSRHLQAVAKAKTF